MTQKKFETLSACDEILKEGYPSQKELGRFPLGEKLKELDHFAWTTTARIIKLKQEELDLHKTELELKLRKDKRMLAEENLGDVYHHHIEKVMEAINCLMKSDLIYDSAVGASEWAKPPANDFKISFLDKLDSYTRMFLRFVALYHDIGKVIHRERHPVLGRHLLESLCDKDRNQFRAILRNENSDWFYLMVQLVGQHDLFGVLNTGEASKLVLIDALRLRNAVSAISYLATLNLADIKGTIDKITPGIIRTVTFDWKFMQSLLFQQESAGVVFYRSDLEKKILMEAQEEEHTTERIKRLITTTFYRLRDCSEEGKCILAESVTNDLVLDALKNRLGPELLVFCYYFALVCKFDYTLRFFQKLVGEWYARNKTTNGEYDVREIAAICVEVLVRLVDNYKDLTRQREGWPRRIGIELLGLTRSDVISDRVIDLLLSQRHTEGVNWIADEATAWYFI